MTVKIGKRLASAKSIVNQALNVYEGFDKVDGKHPWQTSVPDGFVPYNVRRLEKGKVAYFNFVLAREMGLISSQHPDELTPELTQKILDTFAIQIINEYDQLHKVRYPKATIKENQFMATRYLQLQHANKQGKTSGDGRGVWNGVYRYKGTTWDISSRGTGVTCLAPGAVESGKPLKTGGTEFGYGCGLADVSELVGSALLSEIFHLNGIGTERVLAIIDLGKGCGIGVRAAPNLIRPAHLFLYLKQEKRETLRQAVDYMIERQIANREWSFSSKSPDRYRKMLKQITLDFARFTARLEREYIFAWMDWDGDNILANGGIIDYGSIRQFGLRHDQYRYDDVQRFSTTLNEQRGKARQLIQVFAQMVQFLETGLRKPIEAFTKHEMVREYDREFDRSLRSIFLGQVGFDAAAAKELMEKSPALVEELYSSFLTLEKTKTRAPLKRVADGVNRPAVFNMRAVLRELPGLMIRSSESWTAVRNDEFVEMMSSSHAKRVDLRLTSTLQQRIRRFQKAYVKTMKTVCGESSRTVFLKSIAVRAEERNRAGRITGNGAEFVVEEILKARRKGMSVEQIQAALDLFVSTQVPKAALGNRRAKPVSLQSDVGRLYQELVNIAHEFQEDI